MVLRNHIIFYLLFFPEKFEKFSALIWKWTRFIYKGAEKKYITHDIQGRVNDYVGANLKNELVGFEPVKLKVEWVNEEQNEEEFISNGQIILRMRKSDNQNKNFVNASMVFVAQNLLKKAKSYISSKQKESIDLFACKKIFEKETILSRKPNQKTFVPKISAKNFIVTPRLIEISLVAIAVLLLLTYLGFEINNIFSPPPLDISSPSDNLVTDKSTIEVIGQTEKEVKIKINDQEVQIDTEGNFRESVSLKTGLNVIKISAAKKRGRENIIYRQVILTENE